MTTDEPKVKVKRRPPLAWIAITTAVEWIVLAEILYYYLNNGEQTLHAAAAEKLTPVCERFRDRARVQATLNMIRDLPETK